MPKENRISLLAIREGSTPCWFHFNNATSGEEVVAWVKQAEEHGWKISDHTLSEYLKIREVEEAKRIPRGTPHEAPSS